MQIRNIIAVAVFVTSLCGSSDLLAQSKLAAPPSKPAYINTPSKPLFKQTPNEKRSFEATKTWADKTNRRNGY